MEFDLRTVSLAIAVSLSVIALGMLATQRAYPAHVRRSAVRWGLACALQATGWILVAARGRIADVLSIIAANFILSLSATQFEHAIREFKRTTVPVAAIYWPPVAVLPLFVYFTYSSPNFTARVVIISLFGAYQLGRCAIVLMSRDASPAMRSALLTGAGFLAASLTLAIRAAVFLGPNSAERPTTMFASTPVEQISFFVLFISVFLLSFGFLLMCSESFTHDLVRLATLDPLTELFNRRTIEDLARRAIVTARRKNLPVTLAMIDIDNFKQINDTHGHAAGDAALRQVVTTLAGLLRAQDLIGRYGGEEFLIVMPNTDAEQAAVAAERARSVIESTGISLDNVDFPLTISIGLTSYAGDGRSFDAIVIDADRALYAAKTAGRNRVSATSPA